MKSRKASSLAVTLSILAFLVLAASPAWAQVNATTTVGGNWTTSSVWTCGAPINGNCVPNNGTPAGDGYDVGINGGSVLLNSSSTLTSVTIDSLSITSGSLDIQDGESFTTTGNTTNAGTIYDGYFGSSASTLAHSRGQPDARFDPAAFS